MGAAPALGTGRSPNAGRAVRAVPEAARRYRTVEIQAGQHTITAAAPVPDELRQALEAITRPS